MPLSVYLQRFTIIAKYLEIKDNKDNTDDFRQTKTTTHTPQHSLASLDTMQAGIPRSHFFF